jgi:toluene monooxygenase system ferredoxin subunit
MSARWRKLCGLNDVPEVSMRAFRIDGVELLMIRGATTYLIVPPFCPHMAAPLAEGVLDGHVLTCNKHLWQWSIEDGGTCLGLAEAPLLTYPTKEEKGDIYVDLATILQYEHENASAPDGETNVAATPAGQAGAVG